MILKASEDVGKPCERINVVELGGLDQRIDGGGAMAALVRAGNWLGTLPARLSLEQEDAVRRVADQCGYSAEAVERAFRARYWGRAETCSRAPVTIER